MMKNLPYISLAASVVANDTKFMNLEEAGCYFRLVAAAWTNGGYLPNDDRRLAALLGVTDEKWRELRAVMEEFFTITKLGWHQPHMVTRLEAVETTVEKKRKAGKAGGKAKAMKDKDNQASICHASAIADDSHNVIRDNNIIKNQEPESKKEESNLLERGRARDTADHDIPASTLDGLNGKKVESIDLKEEAPPAVPVRQTSMQRQVKKLQDEYMAKFRAEYGTKPQKQYTSAELGIDEKAEFLATLSEHKPTEVETPANGHR